MKNFEEPLSRRRFLGGSASFAALSLQNARDTFAADPQPKFVKPTIIGASLFEVAGIQSLVNDFMAKFAIPGLSLAMTVRGQLKLIACFGHAETEQVSAVQPLHRFRVASVSKSITATAVMKLVELGKLTLNDTVFGSDGRLSEFVKLTEIDDPGNRARVENMTVLHLLEHTAGGWGNKSRDPMFAGEFLGLNHRDLIRQTVLSRPLENRPGEKYQYSNFGYCLLGRIIEAVTKQTYEAAVTTLILKPAGIKRMQIGGRTRRHRLPDEVVYYGQMEDPYHRIMDIKRIDSVGGWVASAIDLTRFAVHVDGFDSPKDVLSKTTVETLSTPSSAGRFYAKGWVTNDEKNCWHVGAFNGASALLARTSDDFTWAVVVNTRRKAKDYHKELDRLPWKIRKLFRAWPQHDLFSRFK